MNSQKIDENFEDFAKVAKFSQVWSSCRYALVKDTALNFELLQLSREGFLKAVVLKEDIRHN